MDTPDPTKYSYVVWFEPSSLINSGNLITRSRDAVGPGSEWAQYLAVNAGDKAVHHDISSGILTGNTTITTGKVWCMGGSASNDSGKLRLYVQGKQDVAEASGVNMWMGGDRYAIGEHSGGATWYQGKIYQVRVYDRVLSDAEFEELFYDPIADLRRKIQIQVVSISADTSGDSGTTELPMLWMNNPNIIQLPVLTAQGYADMGGDLTFPLLAVTATGMAGEVSGIVEFPMLWMNNPQVLSFPVLAVTSSGSLDTNNGTVALPLLWMNNPHIIVLPQFTVNATDGANIANFELPMFTVSSEQQAKGGGEVSLPMFTTSTVAQQGFVHSIFTTLPALSLTAYTGHGIDLVLPIFTMDNSGNNAGLASFNQNLPRMTIKVSGAQAETGIARLFLPEFSLNGNLLTGIISVSGGNRVLPMFTTDLHAYRGENGDGAMSMPMFTTATQAVDNPQGALVQNLKMFTLDAFADQFINRII
jgi:hypothetical protein